MEVRMVMVSSSDVAIFDIEGDGLTPTKIHCLVANRGGAFKATTNYDNMRSFFLNAKVLVGHNITLWDIPQVERLLGIKITAKLVDTLALSWYLYPDRVLHGLESWGEDFGVPKPKIDDWYNLSAEEYIHRCTEDVKINTKLWEKMWAYLNLMYNDEEDVWRFIDYLSFKMDCAREQERSKWKLDVERCRSGLDVLEREKQVKTVELAKAMPRVPVYAKRTKPAKPYKKDGSLSATGAKWFVTLREHGLPNTYDGVVEQLVGENEPNPGSHSQIKDWLFSLGWQPTTFKYVRDKETGDVRKIPQVNAEHGAGICDSVKLLYSVEPNLELLDGLGVISHRISILKGFLEALDEDGCIKASIQGLTNTLRFKHKTAVNLPKAGKPYGELIRGCLIAREGYELCGSDMASLEDRLKQHFIYPYDPEYVEEMNIPGYDPHLSLALSAGEITAEQKDAYVAGTDKSIKPIRDIFKNGNYACQYGAMPPRLALTANINLKKAKQVWEAYWKKNWAIKEAAKAQQVRTIKGQMWLVNPVNGFLYSLRHEKDIFSTLVQGTASYVFDKWVENFRKKRPQLTAQFHDEVVIEVKKGFREKATALLQEAIELLNTQLHLNRRLDIDVQFGDHYAAIH